MFRWWLAEFHHKELAKTVFRHISPTCRIYRDRLSGQVEQSVPFSLSVCVCLGQEFRIKRKLSYGKIGSADRLTQTIGIFNFLANFVEVIAITDNYRIGEYCCYIWSV